MKLRIGWTMSGGRTHALREIEPDKWAPLCCADPGVVYHVGDDCAVSAPTCGTCQREADRIARGVVVRSALEINP